MHHFLMNYEFSSSLVEPSPLGLIVFVFLFVFIFPIVWDPWLDSFLEPYTCNLLFFVWNENWAKPLTFSKKKKISHFKCGFAHRLLTIDVPIVEA